MGWPMKKEIALPKGMLEAFEETFVKVGNHSTLNLIAGTYGLIAAVRWLSENPILPTEKQLREMEDRELGKLALDNGDRFTEVGVIRAWQKRMFLAPEPPFPPEIRDLMGDYCAEGSIGSLIVEAYRRGRDKK